MIRGATYAAGHLITRAALSPPLRHSPLAQQAYATLYDAAKTMLESPERRFFRAHVRPGMVVCDIGAHTGCYSRLLARCTGPRGVVHSFEPDWWSYEILRRRTRGLRQVVPHCCAVADTHGTCAFFADSRNRASSSLRSTARVQEQRKVPVTTLDSWRERSGISRIDALKIDVEGAELLVLKGAEILLKENPPQWILLEIFPAALARFGSTPADLQAYLERHGFALCPLPGDGRTGLLHGENDWANVAAFHRSYPGSTRPA